MNKLSVNAKKTNFMMFTNKKVDIESFHINLAGSKINHVSSLKFLGITIDNKLTWKNTNILRMIYNAIVAPFIDYGISIWGTAANTYLDRIFKLQKRAIRIINHSPFLAHTSSIFYDLKLLNVYDIYKYQLGIFMFFCHRKLLRTSLLKNYSLNC